MSPEADLLKEVPLFELLDDHERTELAGRLDVVAFCQRRDDFNYGEPGDAIYVISSGEVEVFFKNDTGERIVLEVATRGDFFGELSMLDQRYAQQLGDRHSGDDRHSGSTARIWRSFSSSVHRPRWTCSPPWAAATARPSNASATPRRAM